MFKVGNFIIHAIVPFLNLKNVIYPQYISLNISDVFNVDFIDLYKHIFLILFLNCLSLSPFFKHKNYFDPKIKFSHWWKKVYNEEKSQRTLNTADFFIVMKAKGRKLFSEFNSYTKIIQCCIEIPRFHTFFMLYTYQGIIF